MSDRIAKQWILIVDDAPENIDLLANILQSQYEIKAAVSGKKALKIAHADPKPDMILLDIMMPDMDGYEVCRRLKSDPVTVEIPVIFITGSIDTESQKKGFALGAVDYITRPMSPPIVRSRIKTHLQLYDQNRALEEKVRQRTAELEKSRQKLIRSEAHLRTLINALPDLVWLKDAQGVYLSCNAKFERFFGATEAEIIGKTDYDFFDKNLADFFRRKDKAAMAAGRACMNEEQVTYADDGHREILETIKTPMHDVEGNLSGILGIGRDITERKKLEEQIRQTQKMESIGTLAGGIAHDFNNILFPIVGLSEILLEDFPPDSLEHENAQEILKAGKRGSDLVKQILAISRQYEHKMIPVRIQQVLKEVLKLSRSTIPSDIKITNDIQPDCGLVEADPTQMHQIAMNLITNAYHAVEESGGEISVTLREIQIPPDDSADDSLKPGQYVMFSISDTGCGIDSDVMDKIFEPYFTTKAQGKGTGLGLAVVYGIVKEHKGDIEVYSEVGKGTTFNAYLPLMEKVFETKPIEKVEISRSGTEHILLVDDEEPIARLERQILERLGYSVISHTSSVDALDAFRSNPDVFDLVITDMTMLNMTGDQLTKELIAIRADIPVIICTGFSERINKERAEAIGIKGFLMKPVVKSEMAQMVRKVLDGAKGATQQ